MKTITKECLYCKEKFTRQKSSRVSDFCSRVCKYRSTHPPKPCNKVTKKCLVCDEEFTRWPSQGKLMYCSNRCKAKRNFPKKTRNERVFDGRYYTVRLPEHPSAISGEYVYEHRLVVEKHLERLLKKTESVHHVNENKLDNRIENLYLFKTNGAHMSYHSNLRWGNCSRITKSNLT